MRCAYSGDIQPDTGCFYSPGRKGHEENTNAQNKCGYELERQWNAPCSLLLTGTSTADIISTYSFRSTP